jgi:carbamoyl-phosphate synthase large subunit
MENIDPVGVHTGDSIVVAPSQTITPAELKMLKDSATKIVSTLGIEGGCNVQFALHPTNGKYYLIEINPRLSRSSALASKATAYPIARVATKIAIGMSLDEILIAGAPAIREPKLDYVVCKFPRFPFDKFSEADRKLSTQMKATGEVMSIGKSIEEILLKATRSMEHSYSHLHLKSLDKLSDTELIEFIKLQTDETIFGVTEALRRGKSVKEMHEVTKITAFFLEKILNIVKMEKTVATAKGDIEVLKQAKTLGFSDEYIGELWGMSFVDIYNLRKQNNVYPVFKAINTINSPQYVPYLYSTYTGEDQNRISNNKKVIVLGSGPIRIGQGIEFDYSTVHSVWAIQQLGYEAIIINNNPETVSTDNSLSDKLYFEPLMFEDVMNIIDMEKPLGVICALGGQTAINLAGDLSAAGVNILGSSSEVIARAEDRDLFAAAMNKLKIPMPVGNGVFNISEAKETANRIGYPVLVRPSFVLGGRLMHIVHDERALLKCVEEAIKFNPKHPVLIDKYISGKECEVDAVCDGKEVFIPGIMEHIERAGVHSGDSMSVYPTFSISAKDEKTMIDYTNKIGLGLGIVGPFNIQFIVDNQTGKVYVIEVNPRSSRTVPFLAKTADVPVANIATKVMLGKTLAELGHTGVQPKRDKWFVKTPTFSFSKIAGSNAVLSPEMKSTGEAIGYDKQFSRAIFKSLKAAGIAMDNYGTVLVTLARGDRESALPLVRRFYNLGFNLVATEGTAVYLKEQGIRTRVLKKISEGSDEILQMLRSGHVAYVLNTTSTHGTLTDGAQIRFVAAQNKVPVFTCMDTVKVLLDVLENITMGVATINS